MQTSNFTNVNVGRHYLPNPPTQAYIIFQTHQHRQILSSKPTNTGRYYLPNPPTQADTIFQTHQHRQILSSKPTNTGRYYLPNPPTQADTIFQTHQHRQILSSKPTNTGRYYLPNPPTQADTIFQTHQHRQILSSKPTNTGRQNLRYSPAQAVFCRFAWMLSRAWKLLTVNTLFGLEAISSNSFLSTPLPTPIAKMLMFSLWISSASTWRMEGTLTVGQLGLIY